MFEIKVITHVDSSPNNTKILRLIPVSFRKIIDSLELKGLLTWREGGPANRATWLTELPGEGQLLILFLGKRIEAFTC